MKTKQVDPANAAEKEFGRIIVVTVSLLAGNLVLGLGAVEIGSGIFESKAVTLALLMGVALINAAVIFKCWRKPFPKRSEPSQKDQEDLVSSPQNKEGEPVDLQTIWAQLLEAYAVNHWDMLEVCAEELIERMRLGQLPPKTSNDDFYLIGVMAQRLVFLERSNF